MLDDKINITKDDAERLLSMGYRLYFSRPNTRRPFLHEGMLPLPSLVSGEPTRFYIQPKNDFACDFRVEYPRAYNTDEVKRYLLDEMLGDRSGQYDDALAAMRRRFVDMELVEDRRFTLGASPLYFNGKNIHMFGCMIAYGFMCYVWNEFIDKSGIFVGEITSLEKTAHNGAPVFYKRVDVYADALEYAFEKYGVSCDQNQNNTKEN